MERTTRETSNGLPFEALDRKMDEWPAEQLVSHLGRLFQLWPIHSYLFPADKKEQDRLDIFHQVLKVVLQHKLHSPAVAVTDGSRVLDIGCGTGIWLIQLALEVHPTDCLLVGVDVQMTQPERVPETVRFTRADVEAPWGGDLARHGPYDVVNCRLMRGAIKSWPTVYRNIAANLKPGTGVLEQMEFDWTFRNDDGPIPPSLQRWSDEVAAAMETNGTPMHPDPTGTRAMLEAAGFIDIEEKAIMVPVSNWPVDPYGLEMGRWLNLALMHSIYPMALGPLCRVAGRDRQYVEDLDDDAQAELRSQAQTDGVYFILYIWTAKIPQRD